MKKILAYINSNFLLRNILLFVCFGLVAVYIISLLLNLFTRHGQKYAVPSFQGKTLSEARQQTASGELELVVTDSLYIPKERPGTVIDQSPKAGMGVKKGRKVFLTINAYRPRTDIIPYVVGLSLRQAKNRLESKGFEVEQLMYREDIATNNVLGQSYNNKNIMQGSQISAELGSGITLVVGRESDTPLPIVPKVVGLTLREAKSRLQERGFNLGAVNYDSGVSADDYDSAKVYSQSPGQEARNDYGARVSLRLTNDVDKLSKSSAEADRKARQEAKATDLDEADAADEAKMLRELGIEDN